MVIMYTGNIIGKANVLSCDQVGELVEIRRKMGITSGGIPACAPHPTNTQDVVAGHSPLGNAPLNTGSCGCASNPSQNDADIKAITQAVLERLQKLRG
jgi:L-fuculose-phosphate aldolase